MKVDTSSLQSGAVIQTDLCIIGSGAAGLTIAKRLAGTGIDICLVEGGGFEASERSQELYDGEMTTVYRTDKGRAKYDRTYVSRSRLRYFGGTTNHWNGWCRPLEPMDFEARDWVPNSGWPITRTDLDPWYDVARELVEIPAFEADHGVSRPRGRRMVVLKDSPITTRIFHFSKPTRFGTKYRDEVVSAPNVRVFLDSNALRFRTTDNGEAVDRVEVQAEDGPAFSVRARAFAMCCGGIENARLLLVSDDDHPQGLGNGHDNVGRYFMEHPHIPKVGQLFLSDNLGISRLTDFYFAKRKDARVGGKAMGMFSVAPEVQRAEKLQGCGLQLRDRKKEKLGSFGRAVAESTIGVRDLGTDARKLRATAGRLMGFGEQAPNPDSRVTLIDERDRLGMKKVALDWKMTERDSRSIRRSVELFAQHFGASGIGRVRIKMDDPTRWPPTRGGDHHLGTTRMSADPARGVVDANCRLHTVANLYVGGSSVFATSGFCNPTLTITALAARLADHLEGVLSP